GWPSLRVCASRKSGSCHLHLAVVRVPFLRPHPWEPSSGSEPEIGTMEHVEPRRTRHRRHVPRPFVWLHLVEGAVGFFPEGRRRSASAQELNQTVRLARTRAHPCQTLPQAPKGFPLRRLAGALLYREFQSKHRSAKKGLKM